MALFCGLAEWGGGHGLREEEKPAKHHRFFFVSSQALATMGSSLELWAQINPSFLKWLLLVSTLEHLESNRYVAISSQVVNIY